MNEEQATQPAAVPARGFAERFAGVVGGQAKVGTVFGEAIERDGVTVIPAARVMWGFGGGAGAGPGANTEGSGGGGGIMASPMGYLELGNGHARFRGGPTNFAGIACLVLANGVAACLVLLGIGNVRRAGRDRAPNSRRGWRGRRRGEPEAAGV
jgi:hypothetical protein